MAILFHLCVVYHITGASLGVGHGADKPDTVSHVSLARTHEHYIAGRNAAQKGLSSYQIYRFFILSEGAFILPVDVRFRRRCHSVLT